VDVIDAERRRKERELVEDLELPAAILCPHACPLRRLRA
jgi:hypothetical protein